ncbi:reverse transcriptase domain-containing protein [Tanacetum coccineum]
MAKYRSVRNGGQILKQGLCAPNAVQGVVLADFINGFWASLIYSVWYENIYCIQLNISRKNTKNESQDYEAFMAYLQIARKMKEQAPKAKVDLKLVACQMNGEFVASSEEMAKYLTKAKERTTLFKRFSIENIPRNQNQKTDVLSNMRSCILTQHGLEAATVGKPASIAALAILVTGASQSRQHVDTSLIHIESRKPPIAELYDVDSGRIYIVTVNTKEYHSDVLAIITRITRRTLDNIL